MRDLGYHWALTEGNHDDEAELNREELSAFDQTYELSLTKPNAANISHATNYYLPVFDEPNGEEVMRLWFLDSGRRDC